MAKLNALSKMVLSLGDCATSPVVVIRKKEKAQKSKSKIIAPMAMAASKFESWVWPSIAISILPSSGMVMFAKITGKAM